MLQQTRVEVVLPYYQGFMDRFPTVQALAAATLDEVLQVWQGMGYYARARNLHRAAQLVVNRHSGRLPADRQQLTALPGIGQYTASALLSIAFGADELALEGNLRRVLARLSELRLDPRSSAGEAELHKHGQSMLPAGQASQFNQAMMDLGATICTPRSPLCDQCPLQGDCLAYRHGTQSDLPLRTRRTPLPLRQAVAAIWESGGRVLIRRQPADGLLGGLWAFPGGFLQKAEPPVDGLRRLLAQQFEARLVDQSALPELQHSFTHFKLILYPFRCQVMAGSRRIREAAGTRWVELERLHEYPMGSLDRHLASQTLASR